jgi:hypothetical protein
MKFGFFPTGSIYLGFLLRKDLLLCSSYLPLGVPNWVVICPHQQLLNKSSLLHHDTGDSAAAAETEREDKHI